MVKGLYTAYTGMINEQKRLDVLSNNLANADTNGYKKEGTTSQTFADELAIKIKDTSSYGLAQRDEDLSGWWTWLVQPLHSLVLLMKTWKSSSFYHRLFKYDTGHGLVDELLIIMFSESNQTGVLTECGHGFQIIFHMVFL